MRFTLAEAVCDLRPILPKDGADFRQSVVGFERVSEQKVPRCILKAG